MSSILAYAKRQADQHKIDPQRTHVLQEVVDYIDQSRGRNEIPVLNFICTHNSRRSQLAQAWAAGLAAEMGIALSCLSGGTEVTRVHPMVVSTLQEAGFTIVSNAENQRHTISFSSGQPNLELYSKLFSDAGKDQPFAAVLTCAGADESCPVIPYANARIALRYTDPGAFDGTTQASLEYRNTSNLIASEMFHILSHCNQ
ncbi:MAG: protein-tyrosine-phosphatase [Flavobacteriales bacterium]|nr:protein-tyrosine-phosphatase [Flavobacteriales bacterium]